jgi:hypothetical protein
MGQRQCGVISLAVSDVSGAVPTVDVVRPSRARAIKGLIDNYYFEGATYKFCRLLQLYVCNVLQC